jgi:hypothetical protein
VKEIETSSSEESPKRGKGRPKGSTVIDGECKLAGMRISKQLMTFLENEAAERSTFVTHAARSILVEAMNKKARVRVRAKSEETSD